MHRNFGPFRYGDTPPISGGSWGNLPFKDKKSRFTPFSLGKVAEDLGDKSKNTILPKFNLAPEKIPSQ